MTRWPLAVLLLASGACATFRSKPPRYGAFSSETEARSLATTFNCDVSAFKPEYAERRRQPVALGGPFCAVLGRYGDPEYVGRTDVVSTGVARVRYRIDRSYYNVAATRRDGVWTVTSSSTSAR